MLKIVTAPEDVLSQQTKPVAKVDKAIHVLIEEMKVTLESTRDPEGVGLAAPQVGKSLQIFLVKPSARSKTQVIINPQIISDITFHPEDKKAHQHEHTEDHNHSEDEHEEESTKLEGCLSLPNIWGEVVRKPEVVVSYLDEEGKPHKKTFTGFTATIMQHEYDHLHGILFPKRVLEQQGTLYKSSKDKKGEVVFEELDL